MGSQPPAQLSECSAENSRSLDRLRSPKMLDWTWRDLYKAASVELDPTIRRIRVKVAADAIKARASDAGIPSEERRELGNALAILRRLKPELREPQMH
jgi:hypothetical protein